MKITTRLGGLIAAGIVAGAITQLIEWLPLPKLGLYFGFGLAAKLLLSFLAAAWVLQRSIVPRPLWVAGVSSLLAPSFAVLLLLPVIWYRGLWIIGVLVSLVGYVLAFWFGDVLLNRWNIPLRYRLIVALFFIASLIVGSSILGLYVERMTIAYKVWPTLESR